jgi:hypothetical protein
VLTFREDLRPVASFIIGLVVFGLLEIDKALALFGKSLPALLCFYKAEIVVAPDFRQLMNHESVKGYYEKALPKIGRPDMLIPSTGTYNEQS